MKKQKTPENIALAQQLVTNGVPKSGVAAEFGVSKITLFRWLNPTYIEREKKQTQQWKLQNPSKVATYSRKSCYKRRQENVGVKLAHNLRARLRLALLNEQKVGSAIQDLGCSIEYFKQYLEFQFKNGMTWDNYGEWHIDHTKPLASFDLTNREQFLKACHYTNLQPLWAAENLAKGSK